MLGLCKFSEARCHYAHDKTYLPPGPWNQPEWQEQHRDMLEPTHARHSAVLVEQLAPFLKPPQVVRPEELLPQNKHHARLVASMVYLDAVDQFAERELMSRYLYGSRFRSAGTRSVGKGKGKGKAQAKAGKGKASKGKAKGKDGGKGARATYSSYAILQCPQGTLP